MQEIGSVAETDFDQKTDQLLAVAYVGKIQSDLYSLSDLAVQGVEGEEFAGVQLMASTWLLGQTGSFLVVSACDLPFGLAHWNESYLGQEEDHLLSSQAVAGPWALDS